MDDPAKEALLGHMVDYAERKKSIDIVVPNCWPLEEMLRRIQDFRTHEFSEVLDDRMFSEVKNNVELIRAEVFNKGYLYKLSVPEGTFVGSIDKDGYSEDRCLRAKEWIVGDIDVITVDPVADSRLAAFGHKSDYLVFVGRPVGQDGQPDRSVPEGSIAFRVDWIKDFKAEVIPRA